MGLFGGLLNSGLDAFGVGPGSALQAANRKARLAMEAGNKLAQGVTDQQYEAQKNYLNPYAQQGGLAFDRLGDLLGLSGNTGAAGYGTYGPGSQFNMTEMEQDPGYQFRLEQGQKALDNSVAARGMNLSGSQLKGTAAYNQGMASQEYGNAYQRYMDRYKTLGDMGNVGMGAANKLAGYAGQYGQDKSALYTGGATNQANAAQQRGKINADIVGGWGKALDEGMQPGWYTGGPL